MKFWRTILALCLCLACLGSIARAEGDFAATVEEMAIGTIQSAACVENAVYVLSGEKSASLTLKPKSKRCGSWILPIWRGFILLCGGHSAL